MFAVEIDFHDGISPPETILVRRSNAIIGSSEIAHVVIEGAASSVSELRIVRGLGREFSCYPVRRPGQGASPPPFLEGTYAGQADVKLGDLTLHITALDSDLLLGADEAPDRGALRILRAAATRPSPLFPALAVLGARPLFVSFPADSELLVGRSRRCGLRLDSPDVSNEHARFGIDAGSCWVEDLGSTNGTFIGSLRISGRRVIAPGEKITLGSEFILAPVLGEEDVVSLAAEGLRFSEKAETSEYPSVIAYGAEVKPARTVIREGSAMTIGRDPANDIWVNAAHISRKHLSLAWVGDGVVELIDHSSNGTFIDGKRLEREVPLRLERELVAIDLSEGVFVGVCFSESDERFFLEGEASRARRDTGISGPETKQPASLLIEAEKALRQDNSPSSGLDEHLPHSSGAEAFDAPVTSADIPDFYQEPREPSFARQFSEFTGAADAELLNEEYAYELLDEDLYDEDAIRTPYFRGVSRVLLAILVVVLIVCTLVLFLSIFST